MSHPNQWTDIEVVKELNRLKKDAIGSRDNLIAFIKTISENKNSTMGLDSWLECCDSMVNERLIAIGLAKVAESSR